MVPDEPSEQQGMNPGKLLWAMVRIALGGLQSLLGFAFLVGRFGEGPVFELAVHALLLVTGIAWILGWKALRYLTPLYAVAALVGLTVMAKGDVATSAKMWFQYSMWVPAVLALLPVSFRGMTASSPVEQGVAVEVRFKRFLVPLMVLFFGTLFVGFLLVEAFNVRKELVTTRARTQCEETQDPTQCAEAARKTYLAASALSDVTWARKQFEKACQNGKNPLTCTWDAHIHGEWSLDALGPTERLLRRRQREVLTEKCSEGDTTACWARLQIAKRDGDGESVELPERVPPCSREMPLVCDLRVELAKRAGGADLAAAKGEACDAGWEIHCDRAVPHGVAGCHAGNLVACREAAEEATDPIVARAYEAIAQPPFEGIGSPEQRRRMELGYLGTAPDSAEGLQEACDRDVAPACLALGLWEVQDETKEWTPEYSAGQLEPTFGRACRLGMDVACIMGAARLLDGMWPSAERVEKGNELAGIACERGNAMACWTMTHHLEVARGDYTKLRALAERTCLLDGRGQTSACDTVANLESLEREATDTALDDRVYYAKMRDVCHRMKPPAACRRAAQMVFWSEAVGAGQRAVAYTGTALACAQKDKYGGCKILFDVHHFFPHDQPQTADELRAYACEQGYTKDCGEK